ncbi:hypothetical protein X750_27395 [Mesorhizobium sp. LNJC394B00]|nr:hypothetical protein X750_27395 [Mesorhizobium sp. LNJC394B00]
MAVQMTADLDHPIENSGIDAGRGTARCCRPVRI